MAEVEPEVRRKVERFLSLLRERQQVDAVYLYGSQVTGTARPWSDIDVAVVSSDFSDNLFRTQVVLLHLAAQVDDRIEPAPFTPEDFTPTNPLVSEIQRTGVRIA